MTVKSSIGAGDALMAGLVYALSQKMDFRDAVILGVACGTASTLTADSARCSKEDVAAIRNQVVIKNA